MKTMEHFAEIILPFFPEVKDAKPISGFSYSRIELSWLLNNDPNRKHKRSKTIIIIISQEQIDDYENLHTNEKSQFDDDLKKFILYRKSQFDPNHDIPRGGATPQEEWHVEV